MIFSSRRNKAIRHVFVVILAFCVLALPASVVLADSARVAVAANFAEPAREIAAQLERISSHRLVLSFGATGQFYAQIVQGAPFDVLLSADRITPEKAISQGFAVPGTAFTYALGKLVLFSKSAGFVRGEETLKDARFDRIAIANPTVAPYGAAALEVIKALGVHDRLQAKMAQGNSIAQTFQFVDTGNAELGFIALSQIIRSDVGSRWLVPAHLYSPITQDAVLLKTGANNPAAKAFLTYLREPEARKVIESFGYGTSEKDQR